MMHAVVDTYRALYANCHDLLVSAPATPPHAESRRVSVTFTQLRCQQINLAHASVRELCPGLWCPRQRAQWSPPLLSPPGRLQHDPEIVNFAGGGSDAVTAESAVDADEIRETVPPLPPQLCKEPCESDVGVGERYFDRAAFDTDQHFCGQQEKAACEAQMS